MGRRAVEPEAAGCISLRIEIDDQDTPVFEREIGRQVDDRGGLADAAFLVRAGDNFAHSVVAAIGFHVT
jgi:hypothetical protein